jgi:tRNA A-37 threonylcarbamoyl transferase component Bud32
MARKLLLDGRRVWLKDYGSASPVRKALDAVWNALAGALGAGLLRTPPRHPARVSCALEARRIRELAALGVRVPPVLGEGSDMLLLDDIGSALGRELRTASDPSRIDTLVGQAFAGIADVHVRGGYLGQAFARNMAVADAGIGFLDFEDDPLEIMPLHDAQARDWLMFAFGIANYYHGRAGVLADMMTRLRPRVTAEVAQRVAGVAARLGTLARMARYLGADGRAFATAVDALRRSFASRP